MNEKPAADHADNGRLKVFLAILAVLAAGVAIWYFVFFNPKLMTQTKRAEVTNIPVENKTINMIGQWKGEGMRENFIMETIKEFETRNPGVKVNIKWNIDFAGGREGALRETVNQFKTGKVAWDVIWLEPFSYQKVAEELNDQNWAKRYLVDFESVPGFADTQKSFILSDPQYRNHTNGAMTGPYIEGYYQPLFYNKELADKIGIKIKNKGMTFEDLLGYFKQISDYNSVHGTNIPILYDSGDYRGGIGYAPSTWNIFQSLFRSQFLSLSEVEDTFPSDTKLDAVKKTLMMLEKMSKYKPLISGWRELDWFGTRDYVLNDRAVFTACGASWMYGHWRGIDPVKTEKMVPVEMPVYQSVGHYTGGYNPTFAVSKDSPARDEAVKLLMSFSTPNAAEKWVRYAKAPSGIKGNISTAGDTSAKTDQFDDFIVYITDKYGGNVFDSKTVDYILGERYKDLTLKFNMRLAEVMDGKITAASAYAAILGDINNFDNKQ